MAKGRIAIDEDVCKGCQLCINICPSQLIEPAAHYNARGYRPATSVDPDQLCTACAMCAMICPDAAITVFRLIKTKSDREIKSDPARNETKAAV